MQPALSGRIWHPSTHTLIGDLVQGQLSPNARPRACLLKAGPFSKKLNMF